MRMVVDSNYLQAEALNTYLAASTQNHAILTDYASMEAYKGDPRVIYQSMRILSSYPKQVIILKSTRDVCGLSAQQTASPENLIDHDQTRGFPTFCRILAKARGNVSLEMQLLELRRAASEHMDRMLVGMSELNLGFEQMQSTYTVDEPRTLRRGDMMSPAMSAKFGAHILQLAVFLFSSHPDVTTIARGPEVRNTFIFRHAICACLLALRKISEGGAGKTAHPKLRNDLVDANFATFATFFDGLLSADKKARQIHLQAEFLLREVFAIPPAV